MRRALITLAATFALAVPASALANVYIVYTSGFEVAGTTGCTYGGTSGSLVTLPSGNEGCMVQASAAADNGDEAAAALVDDYLDAGGEIDDAPTEAEEDVYVESFSTRR